MPWPYQLHTSVHCPPEELDEELDEELEEELELLDELELLEDELELLDDELLEELELEDELELLEELELPFPPSHTAPVTVATWALLVPLLPCTPNSTVEPGDMVEFQLNGVAV